MYSVWSFFTRRRNFSYLILIALTCAGFFAVFKIQKESNPEVNVPIGIVTTTLPGASAADVEMLITNEIERAISGALSDVKSVTSVSSQGVSVITVEFYASADLTKSIQDLKDRVDTVVPDLPAEANDPRVVQIDFSQEPVITFSIAGDRTPSEFVRIGRLLKDDLSSIPGVSNVSIAGSREREVQVVVNAQALRAYGLNLTDVISAIARSNAALPVGAIQFDGIFYNVQFEAKITDPAQMGDIALVGARGTLVYLRDIAVVSDGLSQAQTFSRSSVDGLPSQPSLTFNVGKQAGGNVTSITRAVHNRLATLQEEGRLLHDMEVLTIFDTGDLLRKDLRTLSSSGILAAGLVMLVLFLTIGWRESLVAGLSIPLSFLIAFIGLLMSGNTLNFVSLFALILSVGILVDSAIVVVEGIHTNMKAWMDKREAALKAIRDFHAPVTAGTMTTVAVFVPLFFISGIVGEFIKSIPFTVISVLLASLVVALGFVPLIASVVLRRRVTSDLEERQEAYTKRAIVWYQHALTLILGHKTRENIFLATIIGLFFAVFVLPIKGVLASLVLCAGVGGALFLLLEKEVRWRFLLPLSALALVLSGTLVSLFPSFATLHVEFFPTGDEDYLIVEMEMPEGTILAVSELEARKIEEILYAEPDIASFVMTVGASSAFTGTGPLSGAKFANAFIHLKDDRVRTSGELSQSLSERLSEIKTSDIRVTQIASGPPVGVPIVIKFLGDDLDELERLAIKAVRILRDIEGTNAVGTSAKDDNTEFVLDIDKAKAAALGLDSLQVATMLRAAIHGTKATVINTQESDIDVVVKLNLNPDWRDPHQTNETTADALRNIEIQTPQGAVLLGSILDVGIRKGATAIRHENGRRVATAESGITAGGNVARITAQFRERAAEELLIPAGVEMIIGGENEETDQSFVEMGYAIIAGLVLMFSIIVLMFNSFRHALYVIAPAFLSFIGIAVGLLVSGNALSFPSLMGLIALVGIVVNNSIILIDRMNALRKESPHSPVRDIVLNGAAARLRPILLTTVTTVIGIVPLLFASSLWAPLALSIIFGLSFAVIITLVMIPVIYARAPGEVPEE